ncbi:MAG: hypothetical protein Q9227_000528 [Pyrenula ochraceoflavens]
MSLERKRLKQPFNTDRSRDGSRMLPRDRESFPQSDEAVLQNSEGDNSISSGQHKGMSLPSTVSRSSGSDPWKTSNSFGMLITAEMGAKTNTRPITYDPLDGPPNEPLPELPKFRDVKVKSFGDTILTEPSISTQYGATQSLLRLNVSPSQCSNEVVESNRPHRNASTGFFRDLSQTERKMLARVKTTGASFTPLPPAQGVPFPFSSPHGSNPSREDPFSVDCQRWVDTTSSNDEDQSVRSWSLRSADQRPDSAVDFVGDEDLSSNRDSAWETVGTRTPSRFSIRRGRRGNTSKMVSYHRDYEDEHNTILSTEVKPPTEPWDPIGSSLHSTGISEAMPESTYGAHRSGIPAIIRDPSKSGNGKQVNTQNLPPILPPAVLPRPTPKEIVPSSKHHQYQYPTALSPSHIHPLNSLTDIVILSPSTEPDERSKTFALPSAQSDIQEYSQQVEGSSQTTSSIDSSHEHACTPDTHLTGRDDNEQEPLPQSQSWTSQSLHRPPHSNPHSTVTPAAQSAAPMARPTFAHLAGGSRQDRIPASTLPYTAQFYGQPYCAEYDKPSNEWYRRSIIGPSHTDDDKEDHSLSDDDENSTCEHAAEARCPTFAAHSISYYHPHRDQIIYTTADNVPPGYFMDSSQPSKYCSLHRRREFATVPTLAVPLRFLGGVDGAVDDEESGMGIMSARDTDRKGKMMINLWACLPFLGWIVIMMIGWGGPGNWVAGRKGGWTWEERDYARRTFWRLAFILLALSILFLAGFGIWVTVKGE